MRKTRLKSEEEMTLTDWQRRLSIRTDRLQRLTKMRAPEPILRIERTLIERAETEVNKRLRLV